MPHDLPPHASPARTIARPSTIPQHGRMPAPLSRNAERARGALAELGDGLAGLLRVERLAVPALLVLEERDALPLDGLREDRGGPLRAARARVGVVDLGEVVAVDDDRIEAERARPGGVRVHVPLELGRSALAETVHVDDRGEVRKTLVARVVKRLPDGALRGLAGAAQHPDALRGTERTLTG